CIWWRARWWAGSMRCRVTPRMVAVVAAARDGRRLSLLGPGLHPLCGPCTCWVRINAMDLFHAVCLAPTRRSAAPKRESQGLRALALPAQGHTKPPHPALVLLRSCPWNLSTHPAAQGSRRRRQTNGVDPCPGRILILLGGPTTTAHGAEKLAVPVDR